MSPPPTTNQRIARAWALLAVLGLLLWLTQLARGAQTEVTVAFAPQFRGQPLVFDELRATNSSGQALGITRLDLLLSGLAVRRTNGTWLEKPYWFAYLSGRAGRTNFALRDLPPGNYDRLRFTIGVPAEQNRGNPAQWDAGHPLNPTVNGLHWNWQGGYVFLALEGNYTESQPHSGTPKDLGRTKLGSSASLSIPNLSRSFPMNRLGATDSVAPLSHPSPAIPLASVRVAQPSVGRDSVESRPARATSVGKPGSTESHPTSGFSWHLATERQLMTVEVPVALRIADTGAAPLAQTLRLPFELARVFDTLSLNDDTSSTHSREDDAVADRLRQSVEQAFRADDLQSPLVGRDVPTAPPDTSRSRMVGGGVRTPNPTNPIGTPYRFTMSAAFPKPALPLDNPLTEEGVALGRRLFNDPLLSRAEKQSCASCHQMDAGTVDAGRAFSVGVDGLPGKRNAMPLYNLAWKSEFFWDGRAKSLRHQALMPIQDALEMHETLENVVRKLVGRDSVEPHLERSEASAASISGGVTASRDARFALASFVGKWGSTESHPTYATMFTRAFGTPDITAERIGLALEQFLLTLTSHDAKFDRVLRGEAKFTEQEQRGFELFHTEHDPRRGQFGADCFHCHGGPLFQNVAFANNGLEHEPRDLGRYLVTGREGDQGKFSVPSLRNVELTAPYMHDGRFATLEDAVFHYVRGVRRSPTLDPNLAKHPPGGVRIPPEDLHALVAFLKTLTEERLRSPSAQLTPKP
ncbi:MAG: hypothetical protein RL514_4180 [Verrucomicrobiota bacterium]|jgi:cytochrome c peroxidase